jgi:hypothetical protein
MADNIVKAVLTAGWLFAMGTALGTAEAKSTAETWDTLYRSQYAVWVTPHYNAAACAKYKTNLDSIELQLDQAIPFIKTHLGISPVTLPQRVEIDSETNGMGGWAAGSTVGYQISDFYGAPANSDGLRWIRGVIIGEVINVTTGTVTDNWPLDWWVDHVWYFPGFIAGEILKESVSPAFSTYWLTSEHYPTYPVYNIFVKMLKEKGWQFYQDFFALILADKMKWAKIGDNPSKIKTDYVIAYLSLAAGRNMAAEFKTAMVDAADVTEVEAIIGVEQGLIAAGKKNLNVTAAWTSFRSGDYAGARTALNGMGISGIVKSAKTRSNSKAGDLGFSAFTLDGRSAQKEHSVASGYYIFRP